MEVIIGSVKIAVVPETVVMVDGQTFTIQTLIDKLAGDSIFDPIVGMEVIQREIGLRMCVAPHQVNKVTGTIEIPELPECPGQTVNT